MFTFAQLDMPLRSTKAVLQDSGFNTQNVDKILNVTGMVKTKISFSIPKNLFPEIETKNLYYYD